MPSASPTTIPECPRQLVKSVVLDDSKPDRTLTLRYEVVLYPGVDRGGLLCFSLDYAGTASWIGVAFSEATRNPQFGRKEAIVGIPGLRTSVAVSDGGASLGQQVVTIAGGPRFFNPGKYDIPAGGMDGSGLNVPSIKLLMDVGKQTLINGSVASVNSFLSPEDSTPGFTSTRLDAVKYLQEPGEIEIDPFGETLFLYAVASQEDGSGGDFEVNPGWKHTYLTLLDDAR